MISILPIILLPYPLGLSCCPPCASFSSSPSEARRSHTTGFSFILLLLGALLNNCNFFSLSICCLMSPIWISLLISVVVDFNVSFFTFCFRGVVTIFLSSFSGKSIGFKISDIFLSATPASSTESSFSSSSFLFFAGDQVILSSFLFSL